MISSSVRERSRMEEVKKKADLSKKGTDVDLLHNKLCIVAPKNSETKVTGIANIKGCQVNINR